jgi:uncharacterized lipoprotein YmbA
MMGMKLGRRRLGLLAAGAPAALLAACSSPNPVLYTIQPIPGAVQPSAPRIIKLRSIGLARYLERPQIVRSSEDYRLDVMANEWWGEPLGAMLGRILITELTQRLPGSTVYLESGAISANADATVEINIERLDQDASGQLILAAQIAVSGRHTDARSVRFAVTPPATTTTGFASAVSTAVAQLADAVAAMVAA